MGPTLFSRTWDAPLAAPGRQAIVCRRTDGLPGTLDEVARQLLSFPEWGHWTSMKAVEKRRREWLMGRAAAKEAVCALAELCLGEHPEAAEIEIRPDAYGKPEAAGSWVERTGFRPTISISHSDGVAAALAAADPRLMVGLDLEHISRRREDFEALAFSPDEREIVDAMPADLRQEWALRMWCAKEALAKALGRGFSVGILTFHILAADPASGEVRLEIRDGGLSQYPHLRDASMIAYTSRDGEFVLSTVVCQVGACVK